ncbi:MAG: WecB/TagA/CpsF family glycosyltransferase [Candidatus Roizmanbacteria bacterium]
MKDTKLFNISLQYYKKSDILKKIVKNIEDDHQFLHIVSLNPEILVLAQHDKEFASIIEAGDIKIADGIGLIKACQLLQLPLPTHITGADLMGELLELAGSLRLRVCLIGGSTDVADEIAKCYQQKYPEAEFFGTYGISDMYSQDISIEEQALFTIVADRRPQLVFVAFGSPTQERWIWKHKDKLQGAVCMGVGGGFDFVSGKVARAPRWMRNNGLEWLFRLILQPWRWRRQLRLIEFIILVLKQKITSYKNMR